MANGANNQELMKEIAELKEENKKLKDRVYTENIRKVKELRGEINKLREENKKLKEEIDILSGLQKGIDIENKKLKRRLERADKILELVATWEVYSDEEVC
tara:strand:+ start:3348 stop:3650 length:303 start_codon:yes stop_codon:yes gene_type:complete